MTDRELLIENNQMLKKICSYIDEIRSPDFINKSEEREFAINVAADLYVESLNRYKNGQKL